MHFWSVYMNIKCSQKTLVFLLPFTYPTSKWSWVYVSYWVGSWMGHWFVQLSCWWLSPELSPPHCIAALMLHVAVFQAWALKATLILEFWFEHAFLQGFQLALHRYTLLTGGRSAYRHVLIYWESERVARTQLAKEKQCIYEYWNLIRSVDTYSLTEGVWNAGHPVERYLRPALLKLNILSWFK